MNRYEALLILNSEGNDDKTQETIERLEGEFTKEGAKIEQIQRMERRNFTYSAGELTSGYYVNFVFEGEPGITDKLQARFKLDGEVYRQHYQKLPPKKAAEKAK